MSDLGDFKLGSLAKQYPLILSAMIVFPIKATIGLNLVRGIHTVYLYIKSSVCEDVPLQERKGKSREREGKGRIGQERGGDRKE